MTSPNIELSRTIALAHLEVSSDESDQYIAQLKNILSHMEQLNTCDTTNIETTPYVYQSEMTLRPDEISQPFGDVKAANPQHLEGPYFVVPQILGEGE